MIDKRKLDLFKELFDSSHSILIMCSDDAIRDQLLAATSLYSSIKENTNKSVKLLCPEDLSQEEPDITHLDEVKTDVGHENLCISLDYVENSIENVSYHVSEETKKFYLTIKPKKGHDPLSRDNVEFSYTGAGADMIILMGVDDLESLGNLYFGYENLYNTATLVSINSYETDFGNYKFDILGTSSFSEFSAQLLSDLGVSLTPSAATNLLTGINEETDGFKSYSATADTFEVVANLMRAGAKRLSDRTEQKIVGGANFGEIDVAGQVDSAEKNIDESLEHPLSNNAVLDDELLIKNSKKSTKKRKTLKNKSKKKRSESENGSRSKRKRKTGIKVKKTKTPNPGDLDYKPTGFGPTGG